MGHDILIIVISLLLGGHRAVVGALEESRKAFHTFQLHPLAQGQDRYYSESKWKDLQQNGAAKSGHAWSTRDSNGKPFGIGARGVVLTLVHRDARDSPLRASSTDFQNNVAQEEADFATIFLKSLQRDAARVRAIDYIITNLQPTSNNTSMVATPGRSNVHDTGPPLQSPIISGLDLGSGEYFTTVSFGSPPSEMLLTIDTGSDLIWLQCHPCESCYDQIGPIFDPAASDSYETVPCYSRACETLPRSRCDGINCHYTENYGDGSFSKGDFATETITMNSTDSVPFEITGVLFGCGHDNEGLFTASSGLLGLGRGHLSFPSQIADVVAPRFSYCLTDRFASGADVRMEGDGGGGDNDGLMPMPTSYLFFGESEASDESMKYTDLLRNPASPTFYYLQLTGMSVANDLVEIPASTWDLDRSSGRGGVILDSGTAVTRLANAAYVALRDSFRSKAKYLKRVVVPNQELFDTCYQLWAGDAVPLVTLHFIGGVDLVLPVDNIIIPVDDSGFLYCLAFARSDSRADFTIIGNIQQQGFRIEFDLGKGKVGFTQQDCSLP